MKKLVLCVIVLLVLGIPLSAGGRSQTQTGRGPVANSAAVVTAPGQLPIVNQKITLTLGSGTSTYVPDFKDNYMTRYIEEKTGLNLEFHMLSPTDTATQFDLMVTAGEKLPDIMLYVPPNWRLYGDDGIFIDLEPLFGKYAYWYNEIQKYEPQHIKDGLKQAGVTPNGKWVGYCFAEDPDTNPVGLLGAFNMINQTWLTKLGLKMPTTTEEFYQTMVAFRDRDPNGNGRRDEIPFIGRFNGWKTEPFIPFINAFVYHPYANNNNFYLAATDGRLWMPYATEEYREALRYLARMYAEGIISPATYTLASDQEVRGLISYNAGEDCRVGYAGIYCSQAFAEGTPATRELSALTI
jgi:putative aldouronate transport system substrate-binding protein